MLIVSGFVDLLILLCLMASWTCHEVSSMMLHAILLMCLFINLFVVWCLLNAFVFCLGVVAVLLLNVESCIFESSFSFFCEFFSICFL